MMSQLQCMAQRLTFRSEGIEKATIKMMEIRYSTLVAYKQQRTYNSVLVARKDRNS
jgi:hypothetical protein